MPQAGGRCRRGARGGAGRWLTESDLLKATLETLTRFSWRALHLVPGQTRKGGWITAMSGPGAKGWPDIFAVRKDRLLAAELKGPKGKPTPEQLEWLEALAAAGVETYQWSPADWPDGITRVLR